jgi:hypothetical protein
MTGEANSVASAMAAHAQGRQTKKEKINKNRVVKKKNLGKLNRTYEYAICYK